MDVTALRNCGLLFLAGGAGALARYGVSELANTLVGRQYPLGTFVVNVLGCFLFGLIWELARLEPFGNGNSKPQFADRELALLRASVVGRNQNVLKLSLMTAAGEHVSAVYFGDVEAWKQYYSEKYGQTEVDAALRGRANAIRMSVIYYPEINVYQGMESVQLIIRNYK